MTIRTVAEYGDEQADEGLDCPTRLARPNSRRERGQGNINFPCSADHEQDWQPYPVDPSLAMCDDHTYVHTYCGNNSRVFIREGRKIKINFPCSAEHDEQDWQPYPVDPYPCYL